MVEHFWRHVVGCPDDLSLLGSLHLFAHVFVPPERESEVDEHDVPGDVVDHHEVLEFEVAVGHLLRVHVPDRNHHLGKYGLGLALAEHLLRTKTVIEFTSFAKTD